MRVVCSAVQAFQVASNCVEFYYMFNKRRMSSPLAFSHVVCDVFDAAVYNSGNSVLFQCSPSGSSFFMPTMLSVLLSVCNPCFASKKPSWLKLGFLFAGSWRLPSYATLSLPSDKQRKVSRTHHTCGRCLWECLGDVNVVGCFTHHSGSRCAVRLRAPMATGICWMLSL
jgi:hypothetical protein